MAMARRRRRIFAVAVALAIAGAVLGYVGTSPRSACTTDNGWRFVLLLCIFGLVLSYPRRSGR